MRRALELTRTTAAERRRLALAIALAAGAAAGAIALLSTSGYLISRAAQRPEILSLMVAIVAVRAFGLSRALLRYAERLVSHDLALRQLTRLRARFFGALVPLVPAGLAVRRGELLSRFVADVDALKDLHLRVLIPVAVAAAVAVGASIAAWLILPVAGLVLLGSLSLLALGLLIMSAGVSGRIARRQAPARAALASELVEAIDGSAELAVAGRAREYTERLKERDGLLARLSRADALAGAAVSFGGQALAGAGLLAIVLVAVPAVHSGALAGVMLAALLFLTLGALEGVLGLSGTGRALRTCETAAGRLQTLTLTPAPVPDPERARAHRAGAASPALRVQRVSYRYGPAEPWVLRDCELELGLGESVALTGPSGAGKSTLAELLVRFRDPDAGSVSLAGIDVRELDGRALRREVLLCGQDSHVFNTSLRENLLIARRGASEPELWEALASVELDGWARSLPDRLETIVGQGGERISGGQRTRLALARALLSPARFLILDEPTAHLDAPLARRMMRRLADARAGRCVVVITHTTDGLERFERVLELRDCELHETSREAVAAVA